MELDRLPCTAIGKLSDIKLFERLKDHPKIDGLEDQIK
jgi:hypothetical protein